MKYGAVFPQAEMPADPVAVRDYIAGVAELGFDHLLVFDTVVGADRASHPNLLGAYRQEHLFHELLVLLGYAAAVAPRLELVTSVVIAPQRQTALLAKQIAELDVLTGGRLRCGLGAGHDEVSFEALGMEFHNRGRRFEEQIQLLRRFWTEDFFDFDGRYHKVRAAGINPLPVQRPVPIWLGGSSERALQRAARLADGYFPHPYRPLAGGWPATIERMHGWLTDAGRDPSTFGLEAWVFTGVEKTPDDWRREADAWRSLGASHLGIATTQCGFTSPDQHLRRLGDALAAMR